jgi:proline iminopeptidase
LIFRGECDYAKWDVTYQYKRVIPNSVLLFVEDAGHMILLERPDLFVDAVRAYLSNEPLPLQPYTKSTPPEAQRRTNPK